MIARRVLIVLLASSAVAAAIGACGTLAPVEARDEDPLVFRNDSARTVSLAWEPAGLVHDFGRGAGRWTEVPPGESLIGTTYVGDGDPDNGWWDLSVRVEVDDVSVAAWWPARGDGWRMAVTDADLAVAGVDLFGEAGVVRAALAAQALALDHWDGVRLPEDSALAKSVVLERDFTVGTLGVEGYARYGTYRWFEPTRVPAPYRVPVEEGSMTTESLDVVVGTLRVWPALSDATRDELGAFLEETFAAPDRLLPEGWTVRGPE